MKALPGERRLWLITRRRDVAVTTPVLLPPDRGISLLKAQVKFFIKIFKGLIPFVKKILKFFAIRTSNNTKKRNLITRPT